MSVDHLSYRPGDLVEMTNNETSATVLVVVLGASGTRQEAINIAQAYLSRLLKWHGDSDGESAVCLDVVAMSENSQVDGLFNGIVGHSQRQDLDESSSNSSGTCSNYNLVC